MVIAAHPLVHARTKGVGFVHVRAFVEGRFGVSAWAATREALASADREELDGVLPIGWYSVAMYARLIRAVDELFGCGDRAIVVQIGRAAADRDAAAIQRKYPRFANPSYAAARVADVWRRHHDTGEFRLDRHSDYGMSGALQGTGLVDAALCRELVGYVGRHLELLGARHVIVDHALCRGHGQNECAFNVRWLACEASSPPSAGAAPASGPTGAPSMEAGGREAFTASVAALPPGCEPRRKLGVR